MIFKWREFVREFKQDGVNYPYIEAKLSELEDLFEGLEDDFYYKIADDLIRIEFGSIEHGAHIGFNINLQSMEMVEDSGDKINITGIEEALDIIEKEVYNYLGISEKIINKKYENATGIATYTPQPYRRVDDVAGLNTSNVQMYDINKVMKFNKKLKKKRRKK